LAINVVTELIAVVHRVAGVSRWAAAGGPDGGRSYQGQKEELREWARRGISRAAHSRNDRWLVIVLVIFVAPMFGRKNMVDGVGLRRWRGHMLRLS